MRAEGCAWGVIALTMSACTAITNVDRFSFGETDAGPSEDGGRDAGPGPDAGDAGDPSDAGPPPDAGPSDGGVSDLPMLEANAPGDATTPAVPDLSCLGARTGPIAGPTVDFDVRVDEFLGAARGDGLTVEIFAGNALPADLTCGPGCARSVASGEALVSLSGMEGSWFAWRVLPRGGSTPEERTVLTWQVNEVVPAMSEAQQIYFWTESGMESVRNSFTGATRAGTDIIAGTVTDCADNELIHAEIRVFDDSGRVITGDGAADGHFAALRLDPFGWDGTIQLTVAGGNYAYGNVRPSGSGRVRVEAWGRPAADGPEVMLSCEEAVLYGNGLLVLNLGPTRSDGPSDCSGS